MKKVLLLLTIFSLSLWARSHALTFIPMGTPEEAIEEAHRLEKALGFEYIGLQLITPYSEEKVHLCLKVLQNKFVFIRDEGLSCLRIILENWDIPILTLNEKVGPAVEALAEVEKRFEDVQRVGLKGNLRFVLWTIKFKQLSSVEKRLGFLRSVLIDPPPRDSPFNWETYYKATAVNYLREIASDEAAAVLQEALALEQKRTERRLYGGFIEKISVSIDEIELRQRLAILKDPDQQVQETRSYIYGHLEIAKRFKKEDIQETRPKTIGDREYYHYVLWPIQQLGLMATPYAIDVIKELWLDPALSLTQRQWAQSILLKLKQVKPEEAMIPMPVF